MKVTGYILCGIYLLSLICCLIFAPDSFLGMIIISVIVMIFCILKKPKNPDDKSNSKKPFTIDELNDYDLMDDDDEF